MTGKVNRRDFLNTLGVTVGVAAGAGAGIAASGLTPLGAARADAPPKGNIPDKPFRTGHMTFLTGPPRSSASRR